MGSMGGGGMGGRGSRFGSSGGMGGMKGSGSGGSMGDNYESQTGHSVHMRGLPFQASEDDIIDFFKPLVPMNVTIHYNSDGRASGQADVDFATHQEASDAMNKDRESMQHRYIELFLKSQPGGGGSFGGGGGYGGNGMGGGGGNFSMNNMGGTNYTAF